jgi:hypothetical protein
MGFKRTCPSYRVNYDLLSFPLYPETDRFTATAVFERKREIWNLYAFYSCRIIGKLTDFLPLQEFR